MSKETETPSLIDVWFDLTDGWDLNAPPGMIPMKVEAINYSKERVYFFYWLIPTIREEKLSFVVFTKKDEADRRFVENCKRKLIEFSQIRILEFISQNREYAYRGAKIYKDIKDFEKIFSDMNREESSIFDVELLDEEQAKFLKFIKYLNK